MDIYNDIFMEYLIKKKKDAKDYLIIALIILGVILFTAVMFFVSVAFIGISIGLLLTALGWYGAYLLLAMRNVEYEYILTNSEMDIDKVMSKKGRKHLVNWDFKNIEICAAVDDINHQHEYKNSSRDKIYNFTGEATASKNYFVDYTDDKGVKVRVIFTPTSKMISKAQKYNMRKVFITE